MTIKQGITTMYYGKRVFRLLETHSTFRIERFSRVSLLNREKCIASREESFKSVEAYF